MVIRENTVNDWEGLVKEFATDRKGRLVDTNAYKLRSKLNHLQNLGFVEFEENPSNPDDIVGAIEITQHWTRTHKILGGQPLEELADLSSGGMVVNPILGRPEGGGEEADIFVIMPFLEELLPVYEDHIVAAARELSLSIKRADDFFTTHHVMSDVWEAICSARVIVADCTGWNPNVFYEIGMAHVVGKPVILITQNPDDFPFDVRQIRYISYELTPRGMEDFEQRLKRTLQTELNLDVQASVN